jgi:hypothetical protein
MMMAMMVTVVMMIVLTLPSDHMSALYTGISTHYRYSPSSLIHDMIMLMMMLIVLGVLVMMMMMVIVIVMVIVIMVMVMLTFPSDHMSEPYTRINTYYHYSL